MSTSANEPEPHDAAPAANSGATTQDQSGDPHQSGAATEAPPVSQSRQEPAPQAQEPEDPAEKAELESKVAAAEKELEELRRTLVEKDKEVEEVLADADAARAALKDAQEKHNAAVKAFQQAEKEKAELQPTYDQCVASKEQRERGTQYKKEIHDLETQLKANEEEITRLDREVNRVSAAYGEEKNALENFTRSLQSSMDALLGAVRDKIAKTIEPPPTGAEGHDPKLTQTLQLNPFDVLDGLEAIVREREREYSHASRLLRELNAICEMKAEEEQTLSSGTAGSIETQKQEDDEYIKNLIYGFQDLRANLQADIEEIRRVNKEQAFNLRRGHYEKKDSGAFTPRTAAGTAAGVHQRQSSFRKEPQRAKEVVAMEKSNLDLQAELGTLKKKLQEATVDRTDSLKTLKRLEQCLQQDQIRFQEDLHKAESDVAAKRVEVERQEKENRRLAEAVEHLTHIVDTTRQQVRSIRSHHDPLPIEDGK